MIDRKNLEGHNCMIAKVPGHLCFPGGKGCVARPRKRVQCMVGVGTQRHKVDFVSLDCRFLISPPVATR